MKTVQALVALSLLITNVACQSNRDSALDTPAPAPVSSSTYTEQPVTTYELLIPDLAGARAAAATAKQQQEVLTYINQARSKPCQCGSVTYPAAPSLTLEVRLNTASDRFAQDMATYNYFSHTGRDNSQPWDRMSRAGYVWRAAGENIAAGYPTPRTAVDGWLKSPGHCRNIMNASFRNIGIGYAYTTTSTYRHYWVTDFGARK